MKDLSQSPTDHARIRHSFRRGLGSYHGSAQVQADIAARLAQMAVEQDVPHGIENAFEFGCGTGHLTQQLLRRFQIRNLLLNDLVPEAAQMVAQQTAPGARVAAGPVETLPLPAQLDLIASASTVQWIAELPLLMARLCAYLAPGGHLLLSGFGHRQFHELASLGSTAAAPSYLDAAEWSALLPAGMQLVAVEQRPQVLRFDTALMLLKHLRQTGVNGQAQQGWSRRNLQAFEERYRAQFGEDGQLPLTYDPVLLLARRAH